MRRMNSNGIVKMLQNQQPSPFMYIYELLFKIEHKRIGITVFEKGPLLLETRDTLLLKEWREKC